MHPLVSPENNCSATHTLKCLLSTTLLEYSTYSVGDIVPGSEKTGTVERTVQYHLQWASPKLATVVPM